MKSITKSLFERESDTQPDGDKLKSNKRSKKSSNLDYEFLPEYLEVLSSPPSSVARYFTVVIISLVLITLIWAYWGRVDIIASAGGRLIIDGHSKTVQSVETGEVARIAVTDGQAVNAGDLLIALNPTATDAESQRLHNQLLIFELEVLRLKALLTTDPVANFNPGSQFDSQQVQDAMQNLKADNESYQVKLYTLEQQIEQNRIQQRLNKSVYQQTVALVNNTKKRISSYKVLLSNGNVAENEYLGLEKELFEAQRDATRIEADSAKLQSELSGLNQQISELNASYRKQIIDQLKEANNNRLDTEKRKVQADEKLRYMEIRSPVSGVVQQLAVHTIGGVVQAAQELMVIVPYDAHLIAEVKVLNKDVGFVVQGQDVEVKVDSFPYTKYGTIRGEVLTVSRDSMKDEQLGLVYPARIRIDKQQIQNEAETIELSAGMSISAEIKTGDRRIIDYVLSPLKEYQSESLKER